MKGLKTKGKVDKVFSAVNLHSNNRIHCTNSLSIASRFFGKDKEEESILPILIADTVEEDVEERDGKFSSLKKKPSVFRMNVRKDELHMKKDDETQQSTLAQNDEAYNVLNKNTKANSLRTKASRFFKPNVTSHSTNAKLVISSPTIQPKLWAVQTVAPFSRPTGPPPPRPERPDSLDTEIVEFIRDSSARLVIQRTSTSTKTSMTSKTTNSSDRRRQSSLRHQYIPDEHFEDYGEERDRLNSGDEELNPTMERTSCGPEGEWTLVRHSTGSARNSGVRGRGTLWKDEKGYYHYVEDV
ncbi:hypothetical protein BDV96DRAFT_325095 [Lophiotrema nucula]|uniref:Uncharacterized protein n=1 Tax=Lophiotrema nucula TaxID=690887 RepID=A0A6A5YII0_9PLEO|nr:hypothetical protein BDV96DRAFT_325095 [Lophiotrema nucula]